MSNVSQAAAPEIERNEEVEIVDPREDFPALEKLRLLWQSRTQLVRFAIWGVLVSALTAFLIPSRYVSVSRLMPPESTSSATAMLGALSGRSGDMLSGYAGDLLGIKNSGALFAGMLRSRTVEDALIRRFDLRKLYGVSRWEDARKELESRTSITEDRKSGIIEIKVSDGNAQRAQALAAAYVEELDRSVSTLSTSAARREREFLEQRLKTVKRDLDDAANNFGQFASKNIAIDIPAQGKAMVEAAARLQGELIGAQAELEGLKQVYTSNNVRVRTVEGRIKELRLQLEKLGGAGNGEGSNSIYPPIRKLPLLGVTYADLYRRTKIEEAVYETLTRQYELAKVQEAKETPSVRVLDPASFPEKHAFPPRRVIIFTGTVLALLAGFVWILGNASYQQTDPDDSRKLFLQQVFVDLSEDARGIRRRVARVRQRFQRAESGDNSPPA